MYKCKLGTLFCTVKIDIYIMYILQVVTTLENKDVNVFICFLLFSPQVPQRKSQTGYFDLDTSLIHCRGVPWATNKRYDIFPHFISCCSAIVPNFTDISFTETFLHTLPSAVHTYTRVIPKATDYPKWLTEFCVCVCRVLKRSQDCDESQQQILSASAPPASLSLLGNFEVDGQIISHTDTHTNTLLYVVYGDSP